MRGNKQMKQSAFTGHHKRDAGNRADQLSSLQPPFLAILPSPNKTVTFRSRTRKGAALGKCPARGRALGLPLRPFSLLQACSPVAAGPLWARPLCMRVRCVLPRLRGPSSPASPATSLDHLPALQRPSLSLHPFAWDLRAP